MIIIAGYLPAMWKSCSGVTAFQSGDGALLLRVRRRRSNLAKQVFSVHCTARRVVATNPAINLRRGAALATNQHLAADETGQLGTLTVCLSIVG